MTDPSTTRPAAYPTPAHLAYAVLDHIDADRRRWRQSEWLTDTAAAAVDDPPPCGTAACFAGWTCLLAGDEPVFYDGREHGDYVRVPATGERRYVEARAVELLNADPDESYALFDEYNTRENLGEFVAEFFGPRPADMPPPPGVAS